MAVKGRFLHWLLRCSLLLALGWSASAPAEDVPEYQLKAAFLYNFTTFTEWPAALHDRVRLCVYGEDPFGDYLDALAGKPVGETVLEPHRSKNLDELVDCQVVFVARSAAIRLPEILAVLAGRPILTVADSPGAAAEGVALNMLVSDNRVAFEANLAAARSHGLKISSRLLRLATDVIQ